MAVKIVIYSESDISVEEGEQLGIQVIPMVVTFGTQEFLDGQDITPTEFYEKLIENRELPKTSQISEFRFEEVLQPIVNKGDEVVLITLSSKLSATNASATLCAKKFNGKVFVVDSLSAAAGERVIALYALRLAKEGKTAKEIATELDRVKEKICIMAVIDTLEYLRKGGRISSATAIAGTLLSIKPVVAMVDGKVKMIGKAMGSKKGNNLLNKIVAEKGGIDFTMPFGAIYSGLDRTMLDKYIKDSSHLWENQVKEVPVYAIGATIGTHVGPGAVGVAFFSK